MKFLFSKVKLQYNYRANVADLFNGSSARVNSFDARLTHDFDVQIVNQTNLTRKASVIG